ncbi:MAG: hypothetical protein KGI38_01515 [Thaumarchaeota archaeon]|nr:hypothetical protein [Nitrososphaerota archaeon]
MAERVPLYGSESPVVVLEMPVVVNIDETWLKEIDVVDGPDNETFAVRVETNMTPITETTRAIMRPAGRIISPSEVNSPLL